MHRPQSYAAPKRRPKPVLAYLRDHPESRAQSGLRKGEESPLSAAGILRLQHTIGNQAVQRLIVQRQPGGGSKTEDRLPPIVASMTLERQGTLKGESRVPGHEGAIEIDSFRFDQAEKLGGVGPGEGRGEEKAPKDVEVSITKATDSSSVALANAALKGERITAARFEFLHRGEGGTVETKFSFEFSNGFVTSFSQTESGGRPGDSFTIQFEAPASK
jgi:type VI protein secretion system component Hcp